MATPGQTKPHNNFSQSGPIAHQPLPPWKKTRSNSLSNELDSEQTLASDETTLPEKLDYNEIRKKFNNPKPPEKSSVPGYNKRPSIQAMPTPISPTFQRDTPGYISSSSRKSTNSMTTENSGTTVISNIRPFFLKPQPLPRPKPPSSPQPLSNGPNNSCIEKALQISMKNVLNHVANSSMEERDTTPSPLPESSDSSLTTENSDQGKAKSVQNMRKFFDEQNQPHVYKPLPPKSSSQPRSNSLTPNIIQISHQPPPRRPPRPEKYLKSQLSGWHSIPSFDPTDSTTGDSSLSSNQNLSRCNSSDGFSDEEEDYVAERRMKLRKCQEEVHATEKTYVNILYVLSVKLSAEVKNTCEKDDNLILTFNNTYKPLLGTIQQIYKLHHELMLPEMEEYITDRRTGNIWSVLQKNFKVIEVLYKHYYVTYYDTQGKLDDLCKNFPLINEAMLKCQIHLGNLYPITQLNCPNQRLLRYILCLKTYMKYLGEHSAEHNDIRSIHDELDRIAVRCEEELVISAAQLNELKERLENRFECIRDHRKLLWHGPLKKQSPRRNADVAPRYMILFSDCILVCSEESGRKLDIKRELSMRGITIEVIQGGRTSLLPNSDQQTSGIVYYPFRVNAVEKSYEFLVDKESDRELWVKKIRQASEDFNKRNITIEVRHSNRRSDEQQLGFRAPAWVNDIDVTRCQNCNNRFPSTLISSRRHHCRSCGRCICGSCSTKKLILEYCKNEGEVRVCDTCYTHFTGTILSKNTSIWPKPTRDIDETILFGDFRTVNSGTTIWIALQEDYQLHVYGAKLDQAEDYAIKLTDLLELNLETDSRTFTLRETTKTHTFSLESNHQIIYEKNDLIDEKLKNSTTKLMFYTDLWYEAMKLARATTLPLWYTRKRDSADSGVSIVG